MPLERELRLEEGPLARGVLRRSRAAFEGEQVDIGQEAQVRLDLIRQTANDAGLLVGTDARVRIDHIHTCDRGGLAVGELVHAEGADYAARDASILRRYELTSERNLLRLV